MDILIVMCIGILVGRVSILRRAKKKNEYLSLFLWESCLERKIIFLKNYHRLV